MKSAASVLRELEKDVDSINESLEMVDHQLGKKRHQKIQLNRRVEEAIRDIAKLDVELIEISQTGRLPGGVKQHIDSRSAAEIKANSQVSGLTKLWNQKSTLLDLTLRDYQKKLNEIRDAFDSLEATISMRFEIEKLASQLDRLKTRRDSVESESSQKINEYKSQKFFQYLSARNFGDPTYSGTGLVARLDRWLAKNIKFEQNNKQLQLLLAMIIRVTDDVEDAQDKLERKKVELEFLESEAKKNKELVAMAQKVAELTREKQMLQEDIEIQRSSLEAIRDRKDEYSVAAINLVFGMYTEADIKDLSEKMINPDDSRSQELLNVVLSLHDDCLLLGKEILELEHSLDERHRALKLAQSFLKEFTQKKLHDKKYEYRDNVSTSDLLSAFLLGNITSSEAFRSIGNFRQEVRDSDEDHFSKSSWSNSYSSSSSSDRDSFSTSDSTGGGGSSTSDSF